MASFRQTVIGCTTWAIWKNATRVTSTKWSTGTPPRNWLTVLTSSLRPASRSACTSLFAGQPGLA